MKPAYLCCLSFPRHRQAIDRQAVRSGRDVVSRLQDAVYPLPGLQLEPGRIPRTQPVRIPPPQDFITAVANIIIDLVLRLAGQTRVVHVFRVLPFCSQITMWSANLQESFRDGSCPEV